MSGKSYEQICCNRNNCSDDLSCNFRSDIHLKMMKNGGNKKLKQFLAKYNLPEDAPIEQKYKTKACYYYREMVRIKGFYSFLRGYYENDGLNL